MELIAVALLTLVLRAAAFLTLTTRLARMEGLTPPVQRNSPLGGRRHGRP